MTTTSQISATTPDQARVWLIVPVFNAAAYLEECLESIASQTYTDLHVVIVDDASTDRSAEIAAEFCLRDPRFQLIQAPHGGVSKARNIGIELAIGRYIGFVDADDRLYPHSIAMLVEALESTGAQVCVGVPYVSSEYRDIVAGKGIPEVMDYETAMKKALYQSIILNSPWGMLMERRLLGDNIRFDETIRYEDLDAFYRFYEGADRIAYLPETVYFYRQYAGSFMHQWSRNRLDALEVTDRIVDYMRRRHPSVARAAADRRFSAHFNLLLLMLKEGVDDKESISRCLSIIRQERWNTLVDKNVRLKNKLGALASWGGLP
ncbi:MAG: glycosyltransferase, partial [Muribaculum sp.]|nr:glycosyltransferase [Muribaculum sp.]